MPSSYKVLGQSNPSAATLTTAYTVPAATSAVTSTISVCNTGSVPTTIRIAVRPAGAAIALQHYVVYDQSIAANDSMFLTLGLALATTDVVSVYAGNANVAFSIFGSEIA